MRSPNPFTRAVRRLNGTMGNCDDCRKPTLAHIPYQDHKDREHYVTACGICDRCLEWPRVEDA